MTERFVCSASSEARDEPVSATASQVRAWLMIEVHGAWGVDAMNDSRFGPYLPDGWKDRLKKQGIRPICIRPPGRVEADHQPAALRLYFVVAARPGRVEGRAWTRTVGGLDEVAGATAGLSLAEDPAGWEPHDERLVIVCTNGKHDQCCANRGRPVARHLRTTRWADQVWECSHIGGDRFAANLVVLPDSLYFGRMEPDEAEQLLDTHAEGRIALEWFRGRSTLKYVEQAVEQALRSELHVDGIDDVVIVPTSDPDRVRAQVEGIGTVEAVVERSVLFLEEALTCQGRPGQKVPIFDVREIIDVSDGSTPA